MIITLEAQGFRCVVFRTRPIGHVSGKAGTSISNQHLLDESHSARQNPQLANGRQIPVMGKIDFPRRIGGTVVLECPDFLSILISIQFIQQFEREGGIILQVRNIAGITPFTSGWDIVQGHHPAACPFGVHIKDDAFDSVRIRDHITDMAILTMQQSAAQ